MEPSVSPTRILMRMDPLPTGTVTILFSDIEGSTALLSRLGKRYGEALSAQRRIMRAAIDSWSGREMGTEGDSFFVVFDTARHAACRLPAGPARADDLQLAGRLGGPGPHGSAHRRAHPARRGLHRDGPQPGGPDRRDRARRAGRRLPRHRAAGRRRAARRRPAGRPRLAPAEGHRRAGADLPAGRTGPAGRVPAAEEPGGAEQSPAAPDTAARASRRAAGPAGCGQAAGSAAGDPDRARGGRQDPARTGAGRLAWTPPSETASTSCRSPRSATPT